MANETVEQMANRLIMGLCAHDIGKHPYNGLIAEAVAAPNQPKVGVAYANPDDRFLEGLHPIEELPIGRRTFTVYSLSTDVKEGPYFVIEGDFKHLPDRKSGVEYVAMTPDALINTLIRLRNRVLHQDRDIPEKSSSVKLGELRFRHRKPDGQADKIRLSWTNTKAKIKEGKAKIPYCVWNS